MEVSPKRFSELAVHTDHVARVSKTIQAAYKWMNKPYKYEYE